MKKLTFLFTLIFMTVLNLSAQEIIFTFNAKDATNPIDSIKATNLVTEEIAFVEGSNTININSFSTGTVLVPSSLQTINVYPNPFANQTDLQFYSDQNDEIKVLLINAAGQVMAEENQSITQGFHKFNISVKTEGIYIINVVGNKKRFSTKIISTTNNHNSNNIKYNGFSNGTEADKSAKIQGGELIHFVIYSGDNITKIADSPTESKTYEVEFLECKDNDGKSYPIVQIGEQIWMAENLAFNAENGCWPYNDDESNVGTYGRLYNWEAAKAACPSGWHLPTDEEWKHLEMAIGMSQTEADGTDLRGTDEGTKLKATSGWEMGGIKGTDDYGFTGLPGGYCRNDGKFFLIGYFGYWWSATESSISNAWSRTPSYVQTKLYRESKDKKSGFSVRCVRD